MTPGSPIDQSEGPLEYRVGRSPNKAAPAADRLLIYGVESRPQGRAADVEGRQVVVSQRDQVAEPVTPDHQRVATVQGESLSRDTAGRPQHRDHTALDRNAAQFRHLEAAESVECILGLVVAGENVPLVATASHQLQQRALEAAVQIDPRLIQGDVHLRESSTISR